MSNRLFQGVIHQMCDAIDRTIGVIDETSVVIACSELGKIGEVNENVTAETMASPAPFVVNGYTYKSFGNHPRPEYAVFVAGNDEAAQKYANLLAVSLSSIKHTMMKSMIGVTLLKMLSSTTSCPAISI